MFKPAVMFRNIRILMMAISLGLSGWAHGAEIHWTPLQDETGLTVMSPDIDITELVNDVVMLKVALKRDERLLSRKVEQGRITNSESLLSLILPGGMLYVAYKKSNQAQAVSEHEQVLAQLNVIAEDINVLMADGRPVVIAKH